MSQDEVVSRFVEAMSSRVKAADEARGSAVAGLELIAKAIRENPGTGQVGRLVGFLGCLYNGDRFPFDMTELRALDGELARACLDVLRLDSFGQSEVHTWGVVNADELNAWLRNHGLYYAAQRRRIGSELYRARYGEDGHLDEGLSA